MAKKINTKPNAKRRRGRPPGAANKPTETTFELPARCVKCQSTKLETLGRVRDDVLHSGVIFGQKYNRVEFKRRRCLACGQYHIVRIYHNSM